MPGINVFLGQIIRVRRLGEVDQALYGEDLPSASVLHGPFLLAFRDILVPQVEQVDRSSLLRLVQKLQNGVSGRSCEVTLVSLGNALQGLIF